MKDEKPTPGEEAIIDGLRSIFRLLDERLPKEEPAWKRDGIIPTLQGSARTKEAVCECGWSDEPHSPQEHRPHLRQDDPDTVTLRRDDAETLLRFWEIAGGNGVVRDTPRRVRAALGGGQR